MGRMGGQKPKGSPEIKPQGNLEEEDRDTPRSSNYAATPKPDLHDEEEGQLGPERVHPKT